MEWIETTAKTIDEAKDLALDKIGVIAAEAEFEVLEEPRQGLFGRTRGQARVRARVAPKAPRAKEDRGRRRRKSGGGNKKSGSTATSSTSTASTSTASTSTASGSGADERDGDNNGAAAPGASDRGRSSEGGNRKNGGRQNNKKKSNREGSGDRSRRGNNNMKSDAPESSLQEVEACVSGFLTGLTTAFDLDAAVEIDTSNDEVYAQIQGKHGLLLGPKARTLDAIQELTRITAQRTAPSSIRIKVDVGGYREQRSVALAQFAEKAAAKAIDEQVEVVLEPMSPPDRKIVHDALNDVDGVSTRSAGADPRRRVIVVPDEGPASSDNDASADDDAANDDAANDGDSAD